VPFFTFIQFLLYEAKIPDVVTHVSHSPGGIHHVTAYHKSASSNFHKGFPSKDITHPSGMTPQNMIGYARFKNNPKTKENSAEITQVHKDWRRLGVATDMYHASTKAHQGKRPVPSKERSDQGKAFWKSRPFAATHA
jgi:hypothetical protein